MDYDEVSQKQNNSDFFTLLITVVYFINVLICFEIWDQFINNDEATEPYMSVIFLYFYNLSLIILVVYIFNKYK